jgi:hypothetical protein
VTPADHDGPGLPWSPGKTEDAAISAAVAVHAQASTGGDEGAEHR